MTIADVLQSVHFLVDHSGKPTAAVVDMPAWEAFLQALEDIEDNQLVRERLRAWRSKKGWTRWEDFERELEGDELHHRHALTRKLTPKSGKKAQ